MHKILRDDIEVITCHRSNLRSLRQLCPITNIKDER
jgi:hypothetical protein